MTLIAFLGAFLGVMLLFIASLFWVDYRKERYQEYYRLSLTQAFKLWFAEDPPGLFLLAFLVAAITTIVLFVGSCAVVAVYFQFTT